jgi:hypothetical protein
MQILFEGDVTIANTTTCSYTYIVAMPGSEINPKLGAGGGLASELCIVLSCVGEHLLYMLAIVT